jgi:hypothetical protein
MEVFFIFKSAVNSATDDGGSRYSSATGIAHSERGICEANATFSKP